MPRYHVPASAAPGLFRLGHGFYRAGGDYDMPVGTKLNAQLIPLDAAAEAELKKAYGSKAKTLGGAPAPAVADGDKPMSVAQAAAAHGAGEPAKGKRISDR